MRVRVSVVLYIYCRNYNHLLKKFIRCNDGFIINNNNNDTEGFPIENKKPSISRILELDFCFCFTNTDIVVGYEQN